MTSAKEVVDEMVSEGQYFLTTEDVTDALGCSFAAGRAALRRLIKRGELVSPFRGHFVVVSAEHRKAGCPPVDRFLPEMLSRLGIERFHLGLLSAVEFYKEGTTSGRRVQVMSERSHAPVTLGDLEIHFYMRSFHGDMLVTELRTRSNDTIPISSPEVTAIELVGYYQVCGLLNDIAPALAELAPKLDPEKLLDVAKRDPMVWAQRLGYIMEQIGHGDLVAPIADYLRGRVATAAPLVRTLPITGCPRSSRWGLAINATVRLEPLAAK